MKSVDEMNHCAIARRMLEQEVQSVKMVFFTSSAHDVSAYFFNRIQRVFNHITNLVHALWVFALAVLVRLGSSKLSWKKGGVWRATESYPLPRKTSPFFSWIVRSDLDRLDLARSLAEDRRAERS